MKQTLCEQQAQVRDSLPSCLTEKEEQKMKTEYSWVQTQLNCSFPFVLVENKFHPAEGEPVKYVKQIRQTC